MIKDHITSGNITDDGPHLLDKHKKNENLSSSDATTLIEFSGFQEQYTRHYIALADAKATALFGFSTTFTAYLFSKPKFIVFLFSCFRSWESWVAWTCTTFLITGAGFAAWVIAPRLRSTGEGLIFFGAVRKHSNSESYFNAVRSSSVDQITEARLRHSYDVSVVCWKKYKNLRAGILFSIIGFASSLFLLGIL